MFSEDMGIDLGTANTLVYIKGKGIVLEEPSVVAVDKTNSSIIAVGHDARKMLGRTPGNIVAVRPLRHGVISDYEITEQMLKYFIKKASRRIGTMRKPRVSVCVPTSVTEVEKRAVEDAAKSAGARQVFIIEETIAAAIGAGIDISRPRGSMIVDMGGGTTDVAVISLGGCVVNASIKTAGDDFDEAIIRFMRKRHNLLIGERTAEELKINVGAAFKRQGDARMEIRGRNLVTGLPRTISVSSDDMLEALKEPVAAIMETIHSVLEKTPPELASDIADRGLVMTGGSALLYGLDKLIKHTIGIDAVIAESAASCVALGTGRYVEFMGTDKKKR
ncbi:MAG: rod shape-determining protein [Defluviitaleaceae bacterium]|nr:rod shape-determining protein [Defluviitaleaceae bacterium]